MQTTGTILLSEEFAKAAFIALVNSGHGLDFPTEKQPANGLMYNRGSSSKAVALTANMRGIPDADIQKLLRAEIIQAFGEGYADTQYYVPGENKNYKLHLATDNKAASIVFQPEAAPA